MTIRIPALIGSMAYDEEDEEISTDLWQEACWIVIRLGGHKSIDWLVCIK